MTSRELKSLARRRQQEEEEDLRFEQDLYLEDGQPVLNAYANERSTAVELQVQATEAAGPNEQTDTAEELMLPHAHPKPALSPISRFKQWIRTRQGAWTSVLLIIALIFGIAFAIYLLTRKGDPIIDWQQEFLRIPSASMARAHVYDYTRYTTVAGTAGDFESAQYTAQKFTEYGLPTVEWREYQVLLSFPRNSAGSYRDSLSVSLLSPSQFSVPIMEPALPSDPTSSDPSVLPAYNAYSASGNVTAELVYVNYGRPEDYQYLNDSGIPLAGKIALARYGQNFRGLKAMAGERLYGIAGLIIFSDPSDDGNGSTTQPRPVYPDGPWRPAESVQRGSVQYISIYSGDPLTPGVPAIPSVVRKYTADTAPNLPHIPVFPISYGSAAPLLRALTGNISPPEWHGGLSVDYNIGSATNTDGVVVGGGTPAVVNLFVQLDQNMSTIWDVVATIPGFNVDSEGKANREASRKILVGNHRDAWVFGAVDPHSGSSVLLELARGLGSIYKSGWRPRRTIQLCSWDAEEFGLVGSTEYVEEQQQDLRNTAVMYLNTDAAISGGNFSAAASPSLSSFIRDTSKRIQDTLAGSSLYDSWWTSQQDSNTSEHGGGGGGSTDSGQTDSQVPKVYALGSGSDYSAFLQFLGISSMDVRFTSGGYGVYHSVYDSFTWMEKFGDPDFVRHELLTKLLGLLVMQASDAVVLPFNFVDYEAELRGFFDRMNSTFSSITGIPVAVRQSLMQKMNELDTALKAMLSAATTFQTLITGLDPSEGSSPFNIVSLNDRMMKVERLFLSSGLPYRVENWYKHVVYAPALYGGYSASVFPGVTEALSMQDWSTALSQAEILRLSIVAVTNLLAAA